MASKTPGLWANVPLDLPYTPAASCVGDAAGATGLCVFVFLLLLAKRRELELHDADGRAKFGIHQLASLARAERDDVWRSIDALAENGQVEIEKRTEHGATVRFIDWDAWSLRLAPIPCAGCGEVFQPSRSDQRFHSATCRKASWDASERIGTDSRQVGTEDGRKPTNPGTEREGEAEGERQSVKDSSSERPEVARLCVLLADLIRERDAKAKLRPESKGWRDEMRRLLDIDGRSVEDIELVVRWSQQHHFWHRNILSAPKLRAQFDRLWAAMHAESAVPVVDHYPDGFISVD
jgi:hypothetical protein